jgi:hypothetical protein
MPNEAARDLIRFVQNSVTQSGLTLLNDLMQAHPARTAEMHAGAIGAQLAVFLSSPDDIRYLDVEVHNEDGMTTQGTVLAITDSLILKITFTTPNNVNEPAQVSAVARRRSDVQSVAVTGATAPLSRDDRWPTGVEVVVAGNGWKVAFPNRRDRSDTLGKLIPELLGKPAQVERN